jgi:IS1 family transposase
VHFLWTMRQKNIFLVARLEKSGSRDCARAFARRFACLLRATAYNSSRSQHSSHFTYNVTSDVHRFEESIAGRLYLIEVKNVSTDRWRAYIVRLPGVPTALMPFYGTTPVEAAHLLCEWLTRAHARAANPVGTV